MGGGGFKGSMGGQITMELLLLRSWVPKTQLAPYKRAVVSRIVLPPSWIASFWVASSKFDAFLPQARW